MPLFRYTAVDAQGHAQAGEIVASTTDEARGRLRSQGLASIDLRLDSSAAAARGALAPGDAAALAGSLSMAVSSGLPLVQGLQALADEAASPRIRSALRNLSDRVAAGASLEAALTDSGQSLPAVLQAVIRAGQRSGRLPLALARYVDLVRESQELRRSLWVSSLYPLVLLLGCVGVIAVLIGFVVPMFDAMFADFDMELPIVTEIVLQLSRFFLRYWMWMLFAVVVLVGVGLLIFRMAVSPEVRSLLLDQLPVIGWMRRQFAIARFCRMLALLMDGDTPFPDAMRLAGSTAHAGLAAGANRLADDVEHGHAPGEAIQRIRVFPKWLMPVFRWHDRGPAFCEALDAAAEMCVARSQAQLTVATFIAEPAVIVTIAVTIAFVVISMFLPLVTLLNELS